LSLLELSHSGTHGEVTPFDTFFQVAAAGCLLLLLLMRILAHNPCV